MTIRGLYLFKYFLYFKKTGVGNYMYIIIYLIFTGFRHISQLFVSD